MTKNSEQSQASFGGNRIPAHRSRAPKPPLDRDDIGYALLLILGWLIGIGIILWRNWYALPESLGVVLMEAAFLTFFCITAWVSVRRMP